MSGCGRQADGDKVGPAAVVERTIVHVRARWVLGVLVVTGLLLQAAPVGATSARQVGLRAIRATESVSALTYAGRLHRGATTVALRIRTDTEDGDGEGTLSINDGSAQVLLVSGVVYLRGDINFWATEAGVTTAQQLAGKWASTAATSPNGSQLARFVDGSEFLPVVLGGLGSAVFTPRGRARVDGRAATVLVARRPDARTSDRLYVARTGRPYVLRIVLDTSTWSGTITFSRFNLPVNPTAPSGAIDLDTTSGAASG